MENSAILFLHTKLESCGISGSLPHSAPMLKRFRSSLKLSKRQKDLAQKMAGLQQRFPAFDWKPFHSVTRFFTDKSMSALEEQAFLYPEATQVPPHATAIAIGTFMR